MKKHPRQKQLTALLGSRLFITGLLLVLQVLFLVTVVVSLSQIKVYIYWAFQLVSVLAVFWILSRPDNPSYKISWIVAILIVPLMGGLFYLIFGDKSPGRKMRRQIEAYAQILSRSNRSRGSQLSRLAEIDPLQAREARYIENLSRSPVMGNTAAVYFPVGEKMFAQMLLELKQAQRFIMLEYFIIQEGLMWNTILHLLEEKAAQGVEIRILHDDAGCIKTLPEGYDDVLRAKGFQVVSFNPFRPQLNTSLNYRDHRKICVIDGNVGFTGGINLADEYINEKERFGHWKDTGVMLKGDGVQSLTEMFLELWQFASGEMVDFRTYLPTRSWPEDGLVQPFGDSPLDTLNVAENAYIQMISHAKDYLYLTTPYLILDNEMLTSLQTAAQSGVDVRIMTPHIPDKWYVHHVTRSFYLPLLEAGVRIFEYTPGFIHAKMFVSDDATAIVGTTNMDYRSFYLHFECGAAFYNSYLVLDVKEDFLRTQKLCMEVTLQDQQDVPLRLRILRTFLRILAPLM